MDTVKYAIFLKVLEHRSFSKLPMNSAIRSPRSAIPSLPLKNPLDLNF